MTLTSRPVAAEARLRHKNQLTLPEAIARALEVGPDDVLLFEVDPAIPGLLHARVRPRTFAGSLTGVFGSTEETLEFVRAERDAWGG